ncbi:hypothetical protein [Pseudomonas fluorescens]|uniref:Uncharacterized protein n=1 Tax=Pseudomonas fluorescens TaxID=294 RepID=A0A0F4TLB1_PSEFL|nr:hypothetical protein [Pseudomonas fluorescens]KJZ44864.1 hypothetical protein VC35_16585 [Pseudomonas fluorescens]
MDTDNAKQGSGLKKIVGWTVATIAAVPVTKMVESYFDVSFFTSMFAAAVAWLGQTIPIHLWLFWVAGIGSILAIVFGVWALSEKRLGEGFAKAELEKAFAKAREAMAKLNAVDATLNATTKELKTAKLALEAVKSELKTAHTKIADLETPKIQPLNEHQRRVLAAIAYYDNSDEECYLKKLSQRIKFTMVQTEGAVDVLVKRKLVDEFYTNGGRGVSLSPNGREYVLHPEFDMSFLP